MKLRNKKTGEIPDKIETIAYIQWSKKIMMVYINNDGERIVKQYDSLESFTEEWEDYEEPKGYFYIRDGGNIDYYRKEGTITERHKSIGNYFETKEEAEKAVEKLKAWKRLKDKGAEFYGWRRNQTGTYELYLRWEDRVPRSYEIKKDLDLLFSREDD